jgi:hypothetical protein
LAVPESRRAVLPVLLLGVVLERGTPALPVALPRWHGCGDPLWPGVDLEKIDVALLREVAKQIDMAAYLSPVEFERKVGLA